MNLKENSPAVHGLHEVAERLLGAEDKDCVMEVEIAGFGTICLVHQQEGWIRGIPVDVATMLCDGATVDPPV